MVPTKMTKLSLYSFFRIYTQVLMPTHLMLKATNLEERSIITIRRIVFLPFLKKKQNKIGLAVGTRVNILFKRLPKNFNHDNKSYSASFLEK